MLKLWNSIDFNAFYILDMYFLNAYKTKRIIEERVEYLEDESQNSTKYY